MIWLALEVGKEHRISDRPYHSTRNPVLNFTISSSSVQGGEALSASKVFTSVEAAATRYVYTAKAIETIDITIAVMK